MKVALSGDGGDELFGGYSRHAVESREHLLRLGGRVASWSLGRLASALPAGFRGRNTLARLGVAPDEACAIKFQFASRADRFKTQIYSPDFRQEMDACDALKPFRQAYLRAQKADPVNRILYVDLKTSLPDDMLVKVDRMSMAHGLEVRAPFLDHHLVELIARLPGRVKVPGPATKPLLRSILNGRISRLAWDRPKHGFTAPIGRWLRAELRAYAEDLLFSPSSAGRDLFDRNGLRRLWEDHLAGRANHEHELWMLLMLEVWSRRHARAAVAA